MKKKDSSGRVPSGGSATINGVLYQMLWSLLRSSSAKIANAQTTSDSTNRLSDVTIILEPIGGGGDLVVQSERFRTVEQLKAKSGGGSWSLREVVESVIPDLYIATINESEVEETEYRFVTEGMMGDWKDVYSFFKSLRDKTKDKNSTPPLDDIVEIRFRRKKDDNSDSESVFWDAPQYTERLLIGKMVSVLRSRKKLAKAESEEQTTNKLLRMLGRFEFVGNIQVTSIQEQIDAHLLAVVDHKEDIPRIRDSLAFELARRATQGNAQIDSAKFFEEQGLNALPLSNWASIRKAAQGHTARALELLQYDARLDVRVEQAESSIQQWPSRAPILLVTGESGSGKSWHSFAICQLEQASCRLSVVVTATNDVSSTLERASQVIWQEIAGHDKTIGLLQISRRLRLVVPGLSFPWLTLIVDGYFEESQLKELLRIDWETWGVRVVVSARQNLSSRFVPESKGRCFSVEVRDFTESELRKYLLRSIGSVHGLMPAFLRNPLRKPLLAGIFAELAAHTSPNWVPSTEYQVFERYWQRVNDAIEQTCLLGLAGSCLNNGADSWSLLELIEKCGDGSVAERLERSGWLRRISAGPKPRYQFSHNRLLNWACANALYQRFLDREISLNDVAVLLKEKLWNDSGSEANHQLSFMPMDFLWICCQNPQNSSTVSEIIESLGGENYNHIDGIYKELLPTLGSAVLGPLKELLHRHVSDSYKARLIVSAINNIGGRDAQLIAEEFIQNGTPLLQIEAARILGCVSKVAVLDSLWALHVAGQLTPTTYLRAQEQNHKHVLYDVTFEALRRCCLPNAEWLAEKVNNISAETQCVSDLVYLVANLPAEQATVIWAENKRSLFKFVSDNKQRCLAYCIDRVSDLSEVDWLVKTIRKRDDLAGAASLRALARLAPALALGQLDQLDHRDFQFTKSWFNEHLLLTSCEATQCKLREMILANPESAWGIASFYEQRWLFVDEQTLKILLDKLQNDLDLELSTPRDTRIGERLYIPLRMLLQATTSSHIELLSTYSGSRLAILLADYVIRIGPRSSMSADSLSRNEAVNLLQRIGGNGYSRAVESLLRADNRFGRSDGLKHAGRLRSPEIAQCLTSICDQQETWDGHYLEQCHAAIAFAEVGEWEPAIRLIRRIGLKVLREVTDLARGQIRPSPAVLAPVLSELPNELKDTPPGDILALGFGVDIHAQLVSQIANQCDPKSETALACVIALDCLNDNSELNVPFLANQLQIENHCFSATNALLANATDSAIKALAKFYNPEKLNAVTVNLLRKSTDTELPLRIQSSVVWRIANRKSWDLVSELHFVVTRTPQKALVQNILSHPEIQDFLWSEAYADEGVVWDTGKKARAIFCLAVCDKPAAIDACKVALRNPDGRDMEYYPQLLIELDGILGARLLLELLVTIESEKLRLAIGRALSVFSLVELFERELNLLATTDCVVASFLARWQKPNSELQRQLRSWLTSNDESLSRSSATALLALRRQEEAGKVSEALVSEVSSVRKWVWIDSLLTLADIGDWHNRWPLHSPNVWECLSRSQRKYLREELKKLRKKEFK